jgi:hypothetical protein
MTFFEDALKGATPYLFYYFIEAGDFYKMSLNSLIA